MRIAELGVPEVTPPDAPPVGAWLLVGLGKKRCATSIVVGLPKHFLLKVLFHSPIQSSKPL
jgi:hypothetical protein